MREKKKVIGWGTTFFYLWTELHITLNQITMLKRERERGTNILGLESPF